MDQPDEFSFDVEEEVGEVDENEAIWESEGMKGEGNGDDGDDNIDDENDNDNVNDNDTYTDDNDDHTGFQMDLDDDDEDIDDDAMSTTPITSPKDGENEGGPDQSDDDQMKDLEREEVGEEDEEDHCEDDDSHEARLRLKARQTIVTIDDLLVNRVEESLPNHHETPSREFSPLENFYQNVADVFVHQQAVKRQERDQQKKQQALDKSRSKASLKKEGTHHTKSSTEVSSSEMPAAMGDSSNSSSSHPAYEAIKRSRAFQSAEMKLGRARFQIDNITRLLQQIRDRKPLRLTEVDPSNLNMSIGAEASAAVAIAAASSSSSSSSSMVAGGSDSSIHATPAVRAARDKFGVLLKAKSAQCARASSILSRGAERMKQSLGKEEKYMDDLSQLAAYWRLKLHKGAAASSQQRQIYVDYSLGSLPTPGAALASPSSVLSSSSSKAPKGLQGSKAAARIPPSSRGDRKRGGDRHRGSVGDSNDTAGTTLIGGVSSGRQAGDHAAGQTVLSNGVVLLERSEEGYTFIQGQEAALKARVKRVAQETARVNMETTSDDATGTIGECEQKDSSGGDDSNDSNDNNDNNDSDDRDGQGTGLRSTSRKLYQLQTTLLHTAVYTQLMAGAALDTNSIKQEKLVCSVLGQAIHAKLAGFQPVSIYFPDGPTGSLRVEGVDACTNARYELAIHAEVWKRMSEGQHQKLPSLLSRVGGSLSQSHASNYASSSSSLATASTSSTLASSYLASQLSSPNDADFVYAYARSSLLTKLVTHVLHDRLKKQLDQVTASIKTRYYQQQQARNTNTTSRLVDTTDRGTAIIDVAPFRLPRTYNSLLPPSLFFGFRIHLDGHFLMEVTLKGVQLLCTRHIVPSAIRLRRRVEASASLHQSPYPSSSSLSPASLPQKHPSDDIAFKLDVVTPFLHHRHKAPHAKRTACHDVAEVIQEVHAVLSGHGYALSLV